MEKVNVSPHADQCNVISLDASEKDCNCGMPPTIIEELIMEAKASDPKPSDRFHWKKEAHGPRGFKILVNPIGRSNDMVGSIHIDKDADHVWIDDLWTDSEYRGKGIAKYIMNLAITEIKKLYPDMECRIIAEPTEREEEVADGAPDAFDLAAFYKGAGFTEMPGESAADGAAILSIPYARDLKVISEVEAGTSGDWKKEGYKFKVNKNADYHGKPALEVQVTHPKFGKVGEGYFLENEAGTEINPVDVEINEDHQRKGLASAMYDLVEKTTGLELVPIMSDQSEDAKKLWDHRLQNAAVTAGMLDFPRKKLPESVWLYGDDPLPRLQPKLRAKILSEARHKLSKFGAKMIGCMLYGGAATYQYHEGGDIDCSVYVDWDSFKGSEDILQDAFKTVEIPWDKYVVHLFVKPSNQTEQIEVADAYYDVLHDDWELPPLVLPKDFDPEVFFKPMVEMAEKKAQKIDLMMGEVSREWSRLKKCLRALKEGARDEVAVRDRAEIVRSVLLDKVDVLCQEFVKIWKARKKLHDQLREKYLNDRNIGRFERFQFPEVCWKYLDEMGYVEFLKVLAKANESGVLQTLIEQATPQLPDNLPEIEPIPEEA